ncbi:hypothetical protein HN587_04260 [Candidatus Woesearchaeota archaeon]|jgi:hypothetical protein|nr:hypothetical protein [Candidatus Woesearchaeota archaeon]
MNPFTKYIALPAAAIALAATAYLTQERTAMAHAPKNPTATYQAKGPEYKNSQEISFGPTLVTRTGLIPLQESIHFEPTLVTRNGLVEITEAEVAKIEASSRDI